MKLTHLCNKRLIVSRMVSSSGINLVFSTVTAKMGHIQPVGQNANELDVGVFGKTFRLYMDGDAGVQEGDRLRDEDNNVYRIKPDGVSRRTFGSMDFLVVLLEKVE